MSFTFKQFHIDDDKCAMKVGTDAVLLGAWSQVYGRVLDVGTGSGVIALMAAQRGAESVVGIDIDHDAIAHATENVERSAWSDSVEIKRCALQDFDEGQFDCIVTNPPYFIDSLGSPNLERTNARHNRSLTFEDIVAAVKRLLVSNGKFSLILPVDEAVGFEKLALESGLYLHRAMDVIPKPDAKPKRRIMEFAFCCAEPICDTLTIELERHKYSEEYRALTGDFYLNLS